MRANIKSISHRCHPILVAFVWELTEETIDLPLGCLQGGIPDRAAAHAAPENPSCLVSLLGPVDPSFRALSGRLKFTVRGHKLNKDSLSQEVVSASKTQMFRTPSLQFKSPTKSPKKRQNSKSHGALLAGTTLHPEP